MEFGIVSTVDQAELLKEAGWDYVEVNAQAALGATLTDEQWVAPHPSVLPTRAAAALVPGGLKIVGPEADATAHARYFSRNLPRARHLGIELLAFGSGIARHVPEGFSSEHANEQVIMFGRALAESAANHGITIAMEPLNRGECNLGNTLDEVVQIVRAVDRNNFGLLFDSYHFWVERDSMDSLERHAKLIRHVHLADLEDRVPPGMSGKSDYRDVFGALGRAGYGGRISVESTTRITSVEVAQRTLKFLRASWGTTP